MVLAGARPITQDMTTSRYSTRYWPYGLLGICMVTTSFASYLPVAEWSGRLILPKKSERDLLGSVKIEIENAPQGHVDLVGKTMWLTYGGPGSSTAADWFHTQKKDLTFTSTAIDKYNEGNNLPLRINNWANVSPLESLAGLRKEDSLQVELLEPKINGKYLVIDSEPVMLSGSKKAFVMFLGPTSEKNVYQIQHYNKETKNFDGPIEEAYVDQYEEDFGSYLMPGNVKGIETHRLNEGGWIMIGDRQEGGQFKINALEPYLVWKVDNSFSNQRRSKSASTRFILNEHWQNIARYKRSFRQVYLNPKNTSLKNTKKIWQENKWYLVIHLFGGGDKVLHGTRNTVTGHLSFGFARIIDHPFTGEDYFEVVYEQVYAHNNKQIVAGSSHWHHYMGNLKLGWMYARPVSEVIIDLPELLQPYQIGNRTVDFKQELERDLEAMTHNYRIGNGTGFSDVTTSNSCSQDSNLAVARSIERFKDYWSENDDVRSWYKNLPRTSTTKKRMNALFELIRGYRYEFGGSTRIHQDIYSFFNPTYIPPLSDRGDSKLGRLSYAVTHWKTVIPRRAHDEMMEFFVGQEKPMWVIQTFQIGGDMSGTQPLAPESVLRKGDN